MTPRARLYARLCDELCMGWPDPYWPQDRAAAALSPDITEYISDLADVVCAGRREANVSPSRKVAA